MTSADSTELLRALAGTIRTLRKGRGWTRREFASETGISIRFLADIETGKANPSLSKLCDIAAAFGTDAVGLLSAHLTRAQQDSRRVIALLGLRGAGKSSVGTTLAEQLECPFVELDGEIESETGLEIGQIFQIYDQTYFRRAEHDTLRSLLVEKPRPFVLATGGGIVTERATFDLLRAQTQTVWLRARPKDHWSRVIHQGDTRPMQDDDRAFGALCTILAERQNLYQQADVTVDTTGRTVLEVTAELLRLVGPTRASGSTPD